MAKTKTVLKTTYMWHLGAKGSENLIVLRSLLKDQR